MAALLQTLVAHPPLGWQGVGHAKEIMGGRARMADPGAGHPGRRGRGVRDCPAPATERRRDRHQGQAVNLVMTASQINGLPVVTIRGGDAIAEVRDVIYSPEEGRLVG